MHFAPNRAARLTIATALNGTSLAAPVGFTDDGIQWVKTTVKIATEVPA